jgi:hypothetical protein
MSVQIERVIGSTGPITVTSDAATSSLVPLGTSAGGMLHCVSTSTGLPITVSWHAQPAADAPTFKLHDSTNVVVTNVIAPGNCYEMPAALFGAAQVRVVAETAGQSAVIHCSLKG